MKKDKSTIIILIVLIVFAIIGYFIFDGGLSDKYDKFKNLIVETKSGKKLQTEYSAIKDKNFFIKVPTEFIEMNNDEKKQKFGVDDIDKVYSNKENTVNVIMDLLEAEKSNSDMEFYKDEIVKNLSGNNSIDSAQIIEIDKYNVVSVVYHDEDEYHHTLYFSYDNHLATISFNVLLDDKDEWLPVSEFVLDSLYFK